MNYLQKKVENGKYLYEHLCPNCKTQRWTSKTHSSLCRSCAGKKSYVKATVTRKDTRKGGAGYITRQGYHLVYHDGKYVPAHRLVLGVEDKDTLVHHIDGNKLNNSKDNLFACSKEGHREIHGQLERLSYFLIQSGFIQFDNGCYSFSTSMKEFIAANSVNSGKAFSVDADGNPEPSPKWGRCNDYPGREYTQVGGSAEDPTAQGEGYDIVSSSVKAEAARKGGSEVTTHYEDKVQA